MCRVRRSCSLTLISCSIILPDKSDFYFINDEDHVPGKIGGKMGETCCLREVVSWSVASAEGQRLQRKAEGEQTRFERLAKKEKSCVARSFTIWKENLFERASPFPQLMHYCSNTHSLGDCLLNQKRIRKFRLAAFLGSVFGIQVQSFFGLKSSSLFYSQTSNFRVAKTKERRAVPPECITEGKISSFGEKKCFSAECRPRLWWRAWDFSWLSKGWPWGPKLGLLFVWLFFLFQLHWHL